MISSKDDQSNAILENQWRGIFVFGGIAAVLVLIGIIVDIVFGSITGGNIAALPLQQLTVFINLNKILYWVSIILIC